MIYYIDLFCGIGGFHQAITDVSKELRQDCECLFAADIDQYAAEMYKKHYGIECRFNLQDEKTHEEINKRIGEKKLTFLFAGFPCQPFSKAGNQEGFGDVTKGTLFFEIEKIVQKHKPKYLLLENVRNLAKHDGGNTWITIRDKLIKCGYCVDHIIISPNEIRRKRIPALRDRIFILCYRNDLELNNESIFGGKKMPANKTSIYKFDDKNKGLKPTYFENNCKSDLEEDKIKTIDMWNDLYHMLKDNNRKLISPLWPHYFNCDLNECNEPNWKKSLIKRNVEFYRENKDIYDLWYSKHKMHFNSLTKSDQKFEWNAKDSINDIWEGIIQFRPSGVRVKKPDFIPTLVAINQTPILGIEKRYLKPEEMAKLYGFKNLDFSGQPLNETYKQLGNTVSVDVVKFLIHHMMETTERG